jgi:hypothetical protein
MQTPSIHTRCARPIASGLAVMLFGLLTIPEPAPPPPPPSPERPFHWNQDEVWLALEQRFREARALGCPGLRAQIDSGLELGGQFLVHLAGRRVSPDAPILDSIEHNAFALAPLVAGCLERLPEYVRLVTGTRSAVKRQSERWDMEIARDRLYRILFGGRAALEEVMLQASPDAVPALVSGDDEPSGTPSTRLLGVTIHSGDLLVSRGGAPVSALVAVGNDYQGNFSHVALVHVDETTGLASVIESSEKSGVHVSTIKEYLDNVKLRVMILRPRADLAPLIADPMLPHWAAALALDRVHRRHTPYDFTMDHHDESRMYCSEVPDWAYRQLGVRLWMDISRISAPGTRRWLADLGVEWFDPREPSDLEYDPQLRVVAEWRDPHTLYMDHVDNVVIEAMLDGAADGDRSPWCGCSRGTARSSTSWERRARFPRVSARPPPHAFSLSSIGTPRSGCAYWRWPGSSAHARVTGLPSGSCSAWRSRPGTSSDVSRWGRVGGFTRR